MKTVIYIILISFVFNSCKAQTIVETKSKDVLIFELKNDNVQLAKYYTKVYHQDNTYKATVEASENREILNKQNISIITQEWQPLGSKYFNKKYSFIRQKDTMNIDCKCGQERNYYFKNLEFKKGNYVLSFELLEEKIQGYQIPTSKEIQNILFKDSFIKITGESKTSYQDTYFRDLKFYEIDLDDTVNVKLRKIEDIQSSKSVLGSGGDYLSNEIFYKVAKMRVERKPKLQTGHLHLPLTQYGSSIPAPRGNVATKDINPKIRESISKIKEIIERI